MNADEMRQYLLDAIERTDTFANDEEKKERVRSKYTDDEIKEFYDMVKEAEARDEHNG